MNDVQRFQQFLNHLYMNEDTLMLECNVCSQDDYVFSPASLRDNPAIFSGVAEAMAKHNAKYHQNSPDVTFGVEVSDEEVQEAIESIAKGAKS